MDSETSSFYDISDILVIPGALALAVGRIGNYLNGELFGRISTIPWCIDYTQSNYLSNPPSGCRHPSQIYESFYSFFIFAVLWVLNRKNLPKGFLTWLFISMYGLLRSVTEIFRQPDEQLGFLIGGVTMGQILSIPLLVVGVIMMFKIWKKGK